MRLFILGATGKTGQALVKQALTRGHTVTTFGRSPFSSDATRKITGNPMNIAELVAAMPNHDAVLSVIGPRGLGKSTVRADVAGATVAAMTIAKVPRLIILSSSFVDAQLPWFPRLLTRTILRNIPRDQREMETAVTQGSVDWTIVRPAQTTNSALTYKYELTTGSPPDNELRMSRSDVAHAMLDFVESGKHSRQVIWLRGAK